MSARNFHQNKIGMDHQETGETLQLLGHSNIYQVRCLHQQDTKTLLLLGHSDIAQMDTFTSTCNTSCPHIG